MPELREFTLEELAAYDGAGGRPVYLLHRGKIYDVTDSPLWEEGRHMDLHQAGHDLTGEFASAPHGLEVFERYPLVGVLKQAEGQVLSEEEAPAATPEPSPSGAREFWERVFRKVPLLRRHPHPMMVHFPIVFFLSAPFFAVLALITGEKSFEATSFHCLGGGIIMTPVVIATGLFTWWFNYLARPLKPVIRKIILSPLLLVMATGAFVWRLLTPEILFDLGPWPSMVYLALLCSLAPLVGLVGWYGASLTFPLHEE